MRSRRTMAALAALTLLASMVLIAPAGVAGRSAGTTSHIAKVGTSSPTMGNAPASGENDATEAEFPGQIDEPDGDPGPYPGTVTNRSLSIGHVANGVSVNSGKKAKSNPAFKFGFEGLDFYQQRYSRGGNQFSVEPPDQGLCVGNGYVLEAINSVVNIFDTSGASALPDNTATNIVGGFPRDVNHAVDINSFYGYAPAINRSTGVRGPFVTDPSCLYDAQTNRWFVVVLTLEINPTTGAFTLVNHLDIAVSQTGNPTGGWNIYVIDVTSDGNSNTEASNACPCLGDYPHIGADKYGFYITTNAYPWGGNGFNGAQIYAFSKSQLAAGAASVNMVHIDTWDSVNVPSQAGDNQPGFTVWPAQSPGTASFQTANKGTEYFLSSNAADEAKRPISGTGGDGTSDQIVLWTLTNTSSINSGSPSLDLANKVVDVGDYAIPPKQQQPGSGTAPTTDVPQGYCLNDETTLLFNGQTGCWKLLVSAAAHARGPEVISKPDANDTRMQQVAYANGKLWGALDTALTVGGDNRAGIAWYILNPVAGSLTLDGYLGAADHDFTYPAIGVTAAGRGVMAFTATGDSLYPSAAYAPIDASTGVGAWNIVPGGTGAAVDDGFTSYRQQVGGNPPRTRWGDYGAAAVDGNAVWLASEYIPAACSYTDWGGPFFSGGTGDNLLGTCAGASHGPGVRAALGNWATFISKFVP